jgi:hypothetical protein
VSNTAITIAIIIGIVLIIGILVWAAVYLKALDTSKHMMNNFTKEWEKGDKWDKDNE